jgi:hypothetical protein
MKYDNFNAVDNGFANVSGTKATPTYSSSTWNWVTISNFVDVYTLFQPNQLGTIPIEPLLFRGSNVNIMGLNNNYLIIRGQVRNLGALTTSAPIITPNTYTLNDLNAMKINFKNILRPLAMAYAQNPTSANLNNLEIQVASLNANLIPKGLRFQYVAGALA